MSGQGYQVGGGDRNDASAIVGWRLLQPDEIGPLTVGAEARHVVTHPVMHRPRRTDIYRAPHIVIRKGFSSAPAAAYVGFDAAFTDDLFGIAGPPQDADDLKVVAGVLNSSLARYWFFMTSSSWGVEREQIHPSEYRAFPIQTIEGAPRHKILQVVSDADRGRSQWQAPLDEAVFAAYDLSAAETDLIRDGLELHLDEHRRGPLSAAYHTTTAEQLNQYAQTLASDLREGQSIEWAVEVAERKLGYVAVACHADPDNRSSRLELEQLLQTGALTAREWESPTVIVEPTLIALDESSVKLIKPDERRYLVRERRPLRRAGDNRRDHQRRRRGGLDAVVRSSARPLQRRRHRKPPKQGRAGPGQPRRRSAHRRQRTGGDTTAGAGSTTTSSTAPCRCTGTAGNASAATDGSR